MPQQTITTTPSRVLRANPYRRSLIFHNPSANIIFVYKGAPGGLVAANADMRIPASGSRTLDWLHDGPDDVAKEWSAVADTGSNTFEVSEFVSKGIPLATFTVKEEVTT